jgi:hypothetical protein
MTKLEAAIARLAAATPGPWFYDPEAISVGTQPYWSRDSMIADLGGGITQGGKNGIFLAHAREDMELLLWVVPNLREAVQHALDHLEGRRKRFSTREASTVILILRQAIEKVITLDAEEK